MTLELFAGIGFFLPLILKLNKSHEVSFFRVIPRRAQCFSVVSNFEMFERLASLNSFSKTSLLDFFSETYEFKQAVLKSGWSQFESPKKKLITQIFFEPSTRTRVSFELAAQRLGLRFSHFQMDDSTSMAKGESISDSLKVFESLNPDLIIFRSKSDEGLNQFFKDTKIPFVCAGLGHESHPTQALLDMFTLYEIYKNQICDLKILFVGDTKFSRVFGSHMELSKILGSKISQCSDGSHGHQDIKNEEDMDDAISKADVVIRLRTQKERGSILKGDQFKIQDQHLYKNKIHLMHPGPFLRGEDFESHLPEHKKSLIWKQKENGLYIRAMIYRKIWSF